MEPFSPVIKGLEAAEIVFAKDQEAYMPLPALKFTNGLGTVVTRWELSDSERDAIALGADIVLSVLTFNQALQPVCIQVCERDEVPNVPGLIGETNGKD